MFFMTLGSWWPGPQPDKEALEMRMGAELAFGALMLLVLVVLGSVTCACRQRALRRRKDRER